jgi:hypothetical protein
MKHTGRLTFKRSCLKKREFSRVISKREIDFTHSSPDFDIASDIAFFKETTRLEVPREHERIAQSPFHSRTVHRYTWIGALGPILAIPSCRR